MLILTRKLGQSITIGDDIKVTILDIHGKQVRLGVVAPQKVVVHREEIYQKIQEENKRAAMANANDLEKIKKVIQNPKKATAVKDSDRLSQYGKKVKKDKSDVDKDSKNKSNS